MIILLDAAPADTATVAFITKWNDAHATQDTNALLALYAAKVATNGNIVSAGDLVKRKMAGFAANPSWRQSIGDVTTERSADGKDAWAHFTKKITDDKNETKEYPMLVIVREEEIIEENDDLAGWCKNKDTTTNGKTLPGFKLSAATAVAAVRESKHFAESRKRVPYLGTDLFGFGCAKRCLVPKRECGFHFRMKTWSRRRIPSSSNGSTSTR